MNFMSNVSNKPAIRTNLLDFLIDDEGVWGEIDGEMKAGQCGDQVYKSCVTCQRHWITGIAWHDHKTLSPLMWQIVGASRQSSMQMREC